MVQIGDFHIGQAQNASALQITAGEAYMLWDHLVTRYDIIDTTQIYQNLVHDPDFKVVMTTGLTMILEKQVDQLEIQLNKYKIALPERPFKSVRFDANSGAFKDEFIFRKVFTGIQGFLDSHVRTIRTMVYNDCLRKMFIKFLLEEIDVLDDLSKYGKVKGWFEIPPFMDPIP